MLTRKDSFDGFELAGRSSRAGKANGEWQAGGGSEI